ncbi:unnamed protein product, partial [Cyprideis torosa]
MQTPPHLEYKVQVHPTSSPVMASRPTDLDDDIPDSPSKMNPLLSSTPRRSKDHPGGQQSPLSPDSADSSIPWRGFENHSDLLGILKSLDVKISKLMALNKQKYQKPKSDFENLLPLKSVPDVTNFVAKLKEDDNGAQMLARWSKDKGIDNVHIFTKSLISSALTRDVSVLPHPHSQVGNNLRDLGFLTLFT